MEFKSKKGLYFPSVNETLMELPEKSGFYVYAILGPWKTQLSNTLNDNLKHFSDSLSNSIIIVLEDFNLIDDLIENYKIPNISNKVCLFITDEHISELRNNNKLLGLLLDFTKIKPDNIPTLLQAIIDKINDSSFQKELTWEIRKIVIKNILDKFSFGVVTTAIGIAL